MTLPSRHQRGSQAGSRQPTADTKTKKYGILIELKNIPNYNLNNTVPCPGIEPEPFCINTIGFKG
jgi:hypothetical protein